MNPRMPAGNLYGNISTLPPEKQIIVDCGINLFLLRRKAQTWQDKREFGFLDVRVSDDYSTSLNQLVYSKRWFSGPTAYITYFATQKGVAHAWCPDDENWFNRVKLAGILDEGQFIVERYHTSEGFLSGQRAYKELAILRDYLWKVNVYKSTDFFNPVKIFTSNEDAENWVAENPAETPYTIKKELNSECKKLLAKYKSLWIVSNEFQTIHRPRIERLIADKLGNDVDTNALGDSLIRSIDSLSDEQRRIIAQKLLGTTLPDMKIVGVKKAAGEPISIDDLYKGKKYDQIKRIAKQLKIEIKDRKLPEIIADIKNAHKKTEAEDEVKDDQEQDQGLDEYASENGSTQSYGDPGEGSEEEIPT